MSTQGSIKRDEARKSWYFVIDTRMSDGKRRQMFRRGFPTKRAASEAMSAIVADQSRGAFVRPTKSTVKTFLLEEWLPAKQSSLKPSTAATYEVLCGAYVVPHIGTLEMAKVDGGTLNALYSLLLKSGKRGSKGLAPKTVRNVHGMLHHAFADAVKWRRLAINPCASADQPRKSEPEMMVWSTDEMRAFRASVADDRQLAIWHLALTTGMRRGELLGIRWSDLDLVRGALTIQQTITMVDGRPEAGTPKTRAGSRTISIDAGTVAVLKAWKKAQTAERLLMGSGWSGEADLVVTEPDGAGVNPKAFTERFQRLGSNAGLPPIRLHDVRHSYATAALRSGVPVKVLSQRLGHADVGVTLKIYAHVLPGDDEAAASLAALAILGG